MRQVSGGADQTVRLWDVDGRKEAAQWPAQRLPFVAISGDGKRVAAADGTQIKARDLSGQSNLLFRRNSLTGAVEVVPWKGDGIALNEALHKND